MEMPIFHINEAQKTENKSNTIFNLKMCQSNSNCGFQPLP